LAFADLFPCRGYDAICLANAGDHLLPIDDTIGQLSMMRAWRLQGLAWEVRLCHFPSVLCLEAAEVLQMTMSDEEHVMLVDCRTQEEWQTSTLDVKLPMLTKGQFMEDFVDLSRTPCTFVMFCTVGGRSGKFCLEVLDLLSSGSLRSQGPVQVRNMLGGIAAWLHGGGRLVDPAGIPTRRVHTWVIPFMDLFPVGKLQLVVDELSIVTQEAKPITSIACSESHQEESRAAGVAAGAPTQIMRSCAEMSLETLADNLARPE